MFLSDVLLSASASASASVSVTVAVMSDAKRGRPPTNSRAGKQAVNGWRVDLSEPQPGLYSDMWKFPHPPGSGRTPREDQTANLWECGEGKLTAHGLNEAEPKASRHLIHVPINIRADVADHVRRCRGGKYCDAISLVPESHESLGKKPESFYLPIDTTLPVHEIIKALHKITTPEGKNSLRSLGVVIKRVAWDEADDETDQVLASEAIADEILEEKAIEERVFKKRKLEDKGRAMKKFAKKKGRLPKDTQEMFDEGCFDNGEDVIQGDV